MSTLGDDGVACFVSARVKEEEEEEVTVEKEVIALSLCKSV